jgi:transposase
VTPPDPSLPPGRLVEIILSPYATIEGLQQELALSRADAQAGRQEIARLVTMVEGLTRQLDELMGERHEELRKELARQREEAKKIAAAAAAGAAGPPPPEMKTNPAPAPEPVGRRRSKHGRGARPAGLRQERQVAPSPCQCPKCHGSKLKKRGTEVTRELDYVRAHVRERVTERDICECEDCGARVVAPQPPMPFERAACTFAMMAWLLFARCGLFLPLDRLVRDFASQGAPIPSATATRWSDRGADLLQPIAAEVRWDLLTRTHIRTDGTGLLVVFPRVKGKPKRGPERPGEPGEDGYLPPVPPESGQVLVFGSDTEAVYHYTPTKEGRHISDFLTLGTDTQGQPIVWKGTITADASSVMDAMFTDHGCTESGCNAHGLRKFRDDADKAPLLASRAMAFIGRVYAIEAEARTKEMKGASLLVWRQQHARPVVADFRAWLDTHLADLLPSNPVRKAMQYYLNHWDALTRFLHDPDVPLDNNWSEAALRKIALLRNNSLFAGGHDGARRLCTVFTLIHTARLHKVDPYDYLEWALTRVVPHPDNRGLKPKDLTPAAYAAFLASQQ